MLEVKPFHQNDITNIKVRKEQVEVLENLDNLRNYAIIIERVGNAVTVSKSGEVVFIGGVSPLHNHVGEGFFIFSENFPSVFKQHAKEIIKGMRDYIALHMFKFRRIQTHVRTDFPEARRFIEVLGFQCEGVMRNYTPDNKDAYLYSRVS